MRASNLVEVVASEDQEMALDGFLDDFYMAHGNAAKQQEMIDMAPPLSGDSARDAYFAAVAEHLALRWELSVPDWTSEEARSGDADPTFIPDVPGLREINLVESPYAFRRRNIFVGREPLQRARWPKDEPLVEAFGRLAP